MFLPWWMWLNIDILFGMFIGAKITIRFNFTNDEKEQRTNDR